MNECININYLIQYYPSWINGTCQTFVWSEPFEVSWTYSNEGGSMRKFKTIELYQLAVL